MKTTVIESGKETATVNNPTADKSAIRPNLSLKEESKTETPKVEATKTELKEALKEQQPARNLDSTIKLALELNRRINQRGKLLEIIGTLEEFEVEQKDDAEETTTNNHFQGCTLSIRDDRNREFKTKNPFIIDAVAKMVNQLCVDKLAEIEGEIFIPA